jgi:hypothetical protein
MNEIVKSNCDGVLSDVCLKKCGLREYEEFTYHLEHKKIKDGKTYKVIIKQLD